MARLEAITRYDLTLLLVPLCFLVTGIAAVLLDLDVHLAMGLGAVASGLPLADSLFVHPPSGLERSGVAETGPGQ